MQEPVFSALNPYAQDLATWLNTLPVNTFCTWTFGSKWPNGPTMEAVRYHVQRWIMAHNLNPAFVVAERGTSGMRRWHGHGLVTLDGLLPGELCSLGTKSLWANWSKRYGRCSIQPLDPTAGAVPYVAKYCAKGLTTVNWWVSDEQGF